MLDFWQMTRKSPRPSGKREEVPRQKGVSSMRQLYIQEPWANLGYESQAQILNDLMIRIQVLENRIRQLEEAVTDRLDEPVGVGR